MAQQTKTAPRTQTQTPPPAQSKGQVAVIAPPRLAYPPMVKEEYSIGQNEWRVLVEAVFPAARTVEAICMALAYCAKRNLDIFKRPVHIVPIYDSKRRAYVETVWPGINELRTTAMRTGGYAGMDKPVFGPKIKKTFKDRQRKSSQYGDETWEEIEATVEFPEWCEITVWRFVQGHRVPFPGPRTEWEEIFSRVSHFVAVPNDRWQKAPVQMLEKTAEAAALRRAFPEEIGDDFAAEEAEGMAQRAVDITGQSQATFGAQVPAEEPKREQYDKKSAGAPPSPADGGAASSDDPGGGDAVATGDGDSKPEVAARQPSSKVTDVEPEPEDKTALDDGDEQSPITFEEYAKVGDFFDFADPWLDDPIRTEAELVAFGAFYYQYMRERMDPGWKSAPVREGMIDTNQKYQAALKRVGQKKQSQ